MIKENNNKYPFSVLYNKNKCPNKFKTTKQNKIL